LEVFIPITLFIVIGLSIWAMLHFRFRTRQEFQQTVRSAMERGSDLTPALLDHLSGALANPFGDLRRGLVSIAIGIGFLIFAYSIGDPDAVGPLSGIASFPIVVGLAYLGLWYFTRQRKGGAP
jgi:hypothetical protein